MHKFEFVKLFFVITLSMANTTYGAGYFTLIGPQTHQLGKPYRAHLVASGYKSPRDIEISLSHKDYPPAVKTERLINDLEKEISIDFIATTDISELTLKAEYTDNPRAVFEQTIKVIAKKYSVLIQTDKAVYKPGDKVQFRVIVLDADLKPYPYNSLSIVISDGAKQKVAKRSASRSDFGVYEDSLQLADELNFEKWAILVIVDGKKGEIHKQNFEVVDYKLPQFEVIVDVVAKDVLLSAGKVRGEIYAKYAFAKGAKFVKGEATLTASAFDPKNPNKPLVTKNIITSGTGDKKSFTVDFALDLNLQGQLNQTLVKLEATFKDDLTKRSLIGSTTVTVHKNDDYSVEVVEGKKFMIPGHSYRFKVKVCGFDGKTVKGNKKLTIHTGWAKKHANCGEDRTLRQFELKLLPQQDKLLVNGVAEIMVNVPYASEAILLYFYFGDIYLGQYKVFRHFTKSGQNLDLRQKSGNKQDVNIKVLSTHGMQKLHSIVIGRSGIIHTQTDNVADLQSFDLRFEATPPMLPSSKLIVYYIQSTGEVVYDQVELKFGSWTDNSVVITAPESGEPGDFAEISVQTLPKSFVGLMAVDRRSSFLATGNDIDESRMQNEISSFTFSDVFNKSKHNELYSFLGEANAVILTDADKGTYDCTLDRIGDQYDSELDEIPSSSRKTRSFEHQQSATGFPETWIFQSGFADDKGTFGLQETVPPSMTSFAISAFSIHPQVGFGLAAPVNLGVSKSFFIEVDLPSSAFIDDVIKVEVFVFNYELASRKTSVVVKLQDDGEFDVLSAEYGRSCNMAPTNKFDGVVDVIRDGVSKTHFFIKPKKAGILKITTSAQLNKQVGHTSSQNIFIEESGLKDGKVKARLFDLRKHEHDSIYFNMGSSDNAGEGPVKLEAFVSGNFIGSAIETAISGLDGSTGGKILNYMAAAYSYQYLKTTEQREKVEQTRPTIEAGYQFVLSRQLSDGNRGYILNAGDTKASVLATSQVAKFLAIIRDYVSIQDVHIVSALEFLKTKQARTGEFIIKDISSEAVYGSPPKSVINTALITLAFLENSPYLQKYKNTIKKALDFINSKFEDAKNDEHALAISAYALAAFGEEESATKFIDELYKTANRIRFEIFWNGTSSSQQISTAAYTILALEKLDRVVETPNILNWLLSKREGDGEFQSSEDTVVGIQAASAMAVHLHSDDQKLNMYIYNEELFEKISISVNDKFMPQTYSIPTPNGATVNVNGTGTALVQMTKTYFLGGDKTDKFSVTTDMKNAKDNLQLKVCIKRLSGQSEVVVAEVRLPGGYEFNENTFDKSKVKSVFTRKNKSLVIVTLDKVQTSSPYCVDINAVSFYTVSSATSIPIKVYDQNDKDRFDVKFYAPPITNVCQ